MWSGLFMLLLLSIVMAAASFFAGILPLTLSLSARQLRLITALGTGVLVGTALIVIIPEGVETLYKTTDGSYGGHMRRSVGIVTRDTAVAPNLINALPVETYQDWRRAAVPQLEYEDAPFQSGPDDGHPDDEDEDTLPEYDDSPEYEDLPPSSAHHDPHIWIGMALVSGFILMYLIDTLPHRAGQSLQHKTERFHISLNNLSFNRLRSSSTTAMDDDGLDDSGSADRGVGGGGGGGDGSSRPGSTTLGLVIHAAADGIALGASSSGSGGGTGGRNLGLVIFLALMLHKAPAAFGLTSVLLKQGLSKRMARAHLVVFSLAAPAGALLTWAAVNILGFGGSAESAESEFATGVLLLFSGGTFLYVAVHTMQEGTKTGGGLSRHAARGDENGYVSVENPYAPSSSSGGGAKLQAQDNGLLEVAATVGGMLLPLLTQWGH